MRKVTSSYSVTFIGKIDGLTYWLKSEMIRLGEGRSRAPILGIYARREAITEEQEIEAFESEWQDHQEEMYQRTIR